MSTSKGAGPPSSSGVGNGGWLCTYMHPDAGKRRETERMEQHHDHHHAPISGGVSGTMLEISLKNCHDAGDLTGIERFLSNAAGVQGVHLDRTRAVAHVTIDSQATNAAALHEALRPAGYACACQAAGCETPAGHGLAPEGH